MHNNADLSCAIRNRKLNLTISILKKIPIEELMSDINQFFILAFKTNNPKFVEILLDHFKYLTDNTDCLLQKHKLSLAIEKVMEAYTPSEEMRQLLSPYVKEDVDDIANLEDLLEYEDDESTAELSQDQIRITKDNIERSQLVFGDSVSDPATHGEMEVAGMSELQHSDAEDHPA